jgi:hypothetical protein
MPRYQRARSEVAGRVVSVPMLVAVVPERLAAAAARAGAVVVGEKEATGELGYLALNLTVLMQI